MPVPSEEQVTDALRSVIDPELRRSIVELEMVRSIERLHGPYWTRRAEMLLAGYVRAAPESSNLAMLVRAAESSRASTRDTAEVVREVVLELVAVAADFAGGEGLVGFCHGKSLARSALRTERPGARSGE